MKKRKPDKAHKGDSGTFGFKRGLTAEKILGATNEPGELYLLVKVSRKKLMSQRDVSLVEGV